MARTMGVELIHAHSPQAKGRVERLFKTLQDRLVKDLRLAGIATIDTANRFLETWLPGYNRRFTLPPAEAADLHRPSPAARELDRILCLKTRRVVRRDWTVAHHGHLYQLETNVRATQIMVEERLDGTIEFTHHGRPLGYHAITTRSVTVTARPPLAMARPSVKPKPTHPWRKRLLPDHQQQAAAARP
jgi:hypothetical protein